VSEGKMACLDPYLGQSLKEIIPNADVVLTFVSVGHGSILQYYDAKSAASAAFYIVARRLGRENTGQRERGLDVAKAGLVWSGFLSLGSSAPLI
jgi:hypothetical protein